MPVVMVQEAAHDDALVSHLLTQTLLAEQEAKEAEELEAKLTGTEQRLMRLTEELRRHTELRDHLSRLEMAVISWVMTKTEVMKRKGEGKKRPPRPRCGHPCARAAQVPAQVREVGGPSDPLVL